MKLQTTNYKLQNHSSYFLGIFKKVFKSFGMHPTKFHRPGGTSVAGQALLELAIFGSLILLLLGVLIGYGLRYDFQQQAQQEAFRKALELAYKLDTDTPPQPYGSASYTVIKDRHIPDPQSPFGVGQVNPIMASASVTRDYRTDATADDYDGLPKTVLHFQGEVNGQIQDTYHNLTTAGLRREIIPELPENTDDYQDLQTKYNIVYGSVGEWCEYRDQDEFEDNCAKEEDWPITIVDSVEGEAVDYDSSIKQARLIMDKDYFIQECERQKKVGSDTDCNAISDHLIETPWYVDGAYHNGQPFNVPDRYAGHYEVGDTWHFPNIENLFIYPVTGRHVDSLGLQPNYTQQTNTDLILTKKEDNVDITTTDNIYWSTVTARNLFYNDHLWRTPPGDPNSGFPRVQTNLVTEDVNTTRSEDGSFTWETPWQ